MNINKAESTRTFIEAIIRVKFVCALISLLELPLLVFVLGSPANAQSAELVQWYCPYCKSWYAMNATCPHTSGGASSNGGASHSHKSSTNAATQQMVVDAFGQALERILNDKPDPAKQAADLKRQQEAAQEKAANEAAARQVAMQSWMDQQRAAAHDKAANRAKSQDLLDKMDSSGGSAGQLAPLGFQWDKPRTDLTLMPAGSVPAPVSPTTSIGQLQAAAGFSEAAAKTGNIDQAQMLAGQAGLVMPGGTTAMHAPLPEPRAIPDVPKPTRVDPKDEIQFKIENNNKKLQALEDLRKEIEDRKRAIGAKDQQAKTMLAQAKQLKDTGQPQDKQNADDLEKAAKELEDNVKQQLTKVDQDTKTLDDQIDKTRNELKQDNATLQNLTKENGATPNGV